MCQELSQYDEEVFSSVEDEFAEEAKARRFDNLASLIKQLEEYVHKILNDISVYRL